MVAAVGGVGDKDIVLGLLVVSDDLVKVLVVVLHFRKAQFGQETRCAACAELHDGGKVNSSCIYVYSEYIPGVLYNMHEYLTLVKSCAGKFSVESWHFKVAGCCSKSNGWKFEVWGVACSCSLLSYAILYVSPFSACTLIIGCGNGLSSWYSYHGPTEYLVGFVFLLYL